MSGQHSGADAGIFPLVVFVLLFVVIGSLIGAWEAAGIGYQENDWGRLLGPLAVTAVLAAVVNGVFSAIGKRLRQVTTEPPSDE